MRKEMLFVALAIIAMLMLPINIIAQEENETELLSEVEIEGDSGITPDSPLWGIDVALDKISYLLTISPEARAKKGLAIAHERLLEIKAMAEKGKVEAVEKAKVEHGKALGKVKEDVEKLSEDANETKIVGIELGMANHLAALEKVKAKIVANPNIPEETKVKLDAKFTSLEARAEEVKVKVLNKKEQIRIRAEEKAEEAEAEEETEIETEEEETEEPETEVEETEEEEESEE